MKQLRVLRREFDQTRKVQTTLLWMPLHAQAATSKAIVEEPRYLHERWETKVTDAVGVLNDERQF